MIDTAGQKTPRIGLALGSGSARGWAHIGVIRALEKAGVRPDIVCGTSIGALVGAAYAGGALDRFETWVLGLEIGEVVGLMDVSLDGGILKGGQLMDFFRRGMADLPIDALGVPFGAVATSLQTGAEVWLRSGSTLDAVRASIALPGLFAPVRRDGALLVDGGLVNPIPVSLARAMGADIVIAVDLGTDVLGRHFRATAEPEAPAGTIQKWMRKLKENLSASAQEKSPEAPAMPSMVDVVAISMEIVQARIARSRMAGDPIASRRAHSPRSGGRERGAEGRREHNHERPLSIRGRARRRCAVRTLFSNRSRTAHPTEWRPSLDDLLTTSCRPRATVTAWFRDTH